ncbi:MAG: hypothetical protein DMG26_08230 [Acidobacteria bacterium]|nr:MAG: hypothetical protein DMG26_08230 [Acidobacteriota bacterium]
MSYGRTTDCKAKGAEILRATHRDRGGQGVPGQLAAFRRELGGCLTLRRPGEYAGDASRSSASAARRALRPAVLQAGRVRDGGNPDRDDYSDRRQARREPSLQREWNEGLAWLERESKRLHGKSFRQLAAGDREKLMMDMSLPERDSTSRRSLPGQASITATGKEAHPGFGFYRLVKEMTVEGFYSSRVGLVDVLEYKGRAFLSEFPGCTHPEHQT